MSAVSAAAPLLEVSKLNKHFGGLYAVKNVSFGVQPAPPSASKAARCWALRRIASPGSGSRAPSSCAGRSSA
jgi:hypothetical protein